MNPILYAKTKFFEFREQKTVKRKFYSNENFRKLDQSLLCNYQRKNPFSISKQFLKKKGSDEIHTYGETPLTTMEKIAKECLLGKEDFVLDLGAGRGRVSLFLAEYIGCRVKGYEQISQFIQLSVSSPKLEFIEGDFFDADFSKATAIYLYGSMLLDREIRALCERFLKNQKIITVSYPLMEYHKNYTVKKVFSGRFSWGETEVYWNERIS